MFDVISIGTATHDVYLKSPLFRVVKDKKHLEKLGFSKGEATCFALGSKMLVADVLFKNGGGAVNAAVTFARQGLRTGAVCAMGDDMHGKDIRTSLKKEKITVFPVTRKDSRTAYSTILLGEEGERTILMYRNEADNVRLRDIPFGKIKTRWAYIAPGTIDSDTLTGVMKKLHKSKALVAINPSLHCIEFPRRKRTALLEQANAIILNREEAALLTGVPAEQPMKTVVKLHEMVPGIAVITNGAKGSLVSDGFTLYETGTFKEKSVVDRTGAGDAFAAGFITGLIHRNEECRLGLCDEDNIKYAIRLATANAASVVEQVGGSSGALQSKAFEVLPRWKSLEIRMRSL